jgi:hypothetical protein
MRLQILFCWLFCFAIHTVNGQSYWQQHVATTISVTLDDQEKILRGFEELIYSNNSPDTLSYIYFHIYPNAYKNDRTAFCEQQVLQGKTDFYYSNADEKGYIDSLFFLVGNEIVDYFYVDEWEDVIRIDLPQILLPGEKIKISTPFKVKLPKVFSRLGYSNQTFYISQWYPKPAVYDIKGWHPQPYLDQGEFYSEFGSYDVSITLPKSYILLATGNCANENEEQWWSNLAKNENSSEIANPSIEELKTIRFVENNVHDFAWFADKNWVLSVDSFQYSNSDSIIKIITAYFPEQQSKWKNSTAYLKKTLQLYGEQIGKYPYKTIKAVEGNMYAGSGMEYPTITIIDKSASDYLPSVLSHEAGHNWFYGILGSNERAHPWMDEGLNSFYEDKVVDIINPKNKSSIDVLLEQRLLFQQQSVNRDQSVLLNSENYSSPNYGLDVYKKAALYFKHLEQYLGVDTFKLAMQHYYDKWKFKHPQPEDLKNAFESISKKELSWFFEDLLPLDRKIELKLVKAKNYGDSIRIKIRNQSNVSMPNRIGVFNHDTLVKIVAIEPFKNDTSLNVQQIDWTKMRILDDYVDFKIANNSFYKNGLFKNNPLQLSLFLGLNRMKKNTAYLSLANAYNVYDGHGVGVFFHNISVPQNRLQFFIAPLYSYKNNRFNGVGGISYSWFPNLIFKEIRLQSDFKTFSQYKSSLNIEETIFTRYFKVAPSIEFVLKEDALSKRTRVFNVKLYRIYEQYFDYYQNFTLDSLYRPMIQSRNQYFLSAKYMHENNRTFHPYNYCASALLNERFIKIEVAANLKINYDVPKKALYLRVYGAKLFSLQGEAINNRFWLNSTSTNSNDYLYNELFVGRNKNEGFFSKQIIFNEGGFKTPTNMLINPVGRSDNWLLALNVKTDLPLGKIPLKLYADIGTFANAKQINTSQQALLMQCGFELNLFNNAVSIYVPIVMSSDFSDYLKSMYGKNRLLNSITYSINIGKINALRANELLMNKILY